MPKPSYQIDAALCVLSELDAPTWAQLADLTAQHRAGRLSRQAWQCATDALLERATRER